ncbi:uncharacterized protein [Spinacia oleracea]|uniref:Uncharacterized protein n=1 Tax=Spinacia oleracea TaxID=3562 RepID=A0ABM3QZ38_SPIOL|nr:uncharacterized protein LOC130463523 [Spinacia oleracea]
MAYADLNLRLLYQYGNWGKSRGQDHERYGDARKNNSEQEEALNDPYEWNWCGFLYEWIGGHGRERGKASAFILLIAYLDRLKYKKTAKGWRTDVPRLGCWQTKDVYDLINQDSGPDGTFGHAEVVQDVLYGKPCPINVQTEIPPWLKDRLDTTAEKPDPPPKEALKTALRRRFKQPSSSQRKSVRSSNEPSTIPCQTSPKATEKNTSPVEHTVPQENPVVENRDESNDNDRESVNSLERIGRYIPKPMVEPTQRKISEKVLDQNKFEDQVLVQDQNHLVTRGMLYRSFKKIEKLTWRLCVLGVPI